MTKTTCINTCSTSNLVCIILLWDTLVDYTHLSLFFSKGHNTFCDNTIIVLQNLMQRVNRSDANYCWNDHLSPLRRIIAVISLLHLISPINWRINLFELILLYSIMTIWSHLVKYIYLPWSWYFFNVFTLFNATKDETFHRYGNILKASDWHLH